MNKLTKGIIPNFKKFWGYSFFYVSFLSTLVLCLINSIKGKTAPDFDIFTISAQKLLNGENPYGITYDSGQYLYSPSAGMFFYSLFSHIPYALGISLYTLFIAACFIYAVKKLSNSSKLSSVSKNLFLFLISFEALGSLLNIKFELVTVACLLLYLCVSQTKEKTTPKDSALALLSNFKLQALAPAGLIFIALSSASLKKALRFLAIFSLSFFIAFLLPALIVGFEENIKLHKSWMIESKNFITLTQNARSSLWNFVDAILTFPLSHTFKSIANLLVAVFLAAWCFFIKDKNLQAPYLRPVALGSAYAIVFSPAAQSSAYILLAPLFFALVSIREKLAKSSLIKIWNVGIVLSFSLISIIYSDLVPKALRAFARENAIKSLGGFILILMYLYFDFLENKNRKLLTQ